MVFHWSLCAGKSPQVSWTFLNILTDLINAVVWTVSTPPLISKSSSFCINPLVTVPRAPITVGIITTFMFYGFFFYSLARSRYLSFFSHSLNFTLRSAGTAKSTILQVLFFFVDSASNLEQVQAATPHKTPTVRQPASYHENYSS